MTSNSSNKKPRAAATWTSPLSLALVVSSGAAFGIAMNKGNVHLPAVIQSQMSMQRFTMMKMFLAALGTSKLSMAAFRAIEPEAFDAIQKRRACDPSNSAVLVTGGLLLGAGMTVSGSCPGSVYVQLGAGIPSAWPVYLGVLSGTLVFGIIKPAITKWQANKCKVNTTLPLSGWLQTLTGLALIGLSTGLELAIPEAIQGSAWYPTIAGIAVGLLQLPLMFHMDKSLGATASYKIVLGETADYIREATGWKLSWLHLPRFTDKSTLLFALGIIAGSAFVQSEPYIGPVPPSWAAYIGGALIGLGANVAGGCTSGHGLSGVAQLMKSSSIVLPCIFIGAMATALVTHYVF